MQIYHRGLIFVAVGLTVGFIVGACSPNLPTGTIEKKYYATGPWALTPPSATGHALYFPPTPGPHPSLHSTTPCGTGTAGNPTTAPPLLKPLAPCALAIIPTQ